MLVGRVRGEDVVALVDPASPVLSLEPTGVAKRNVFLLQPSLEALVRKGLIIPITGPQGLWP